MSAALFALAGTLVGVLGTVLADYARGRREDQKLWGKSLSPYALILYTRYLDSGRSDSNCTSVLMMLNCSVPHRKHIHDLVPYRRDCD